MYARMCIRYKNFTPDLLLWKLWLNPTVVIESVRLFRLPLSITSTCIPRSRFQIRTFVSFVVFSLWSQGNAARADWQVVLRWEPEESVDKHYQTLDQQDPRIHQERKWVLWDFGRDVLCFLKRWAEQSVLSVAEESKSLSHYFVFVGTIYSSRLHPISIPLTTLHSTSSKCSIQNGSYKIVFVRRSGHTIRLAQTREPHESEARLPSVHSKQNCRALKRKELLKRKKREE